MDYGLEIPKSYSFSKLLHLLIQVIRLLAKYLASYYEAKTLDKGIPKGWKPKEISPLFQG